MTKSKIELVYFERCPHVDGARERLAEAFDRTGRPREWTEWEVGDPEIPRDRKPYGSPTVLIDGKPVGDTEAAASGRACRADGGASTDEIARALERVG